MPKNSSGMQKSYFWTGFLHKKLTNQKSHSESLCTVWSCEKWQAISWPMVRSPPPFKINILRGVDIFKRQNLYRNHAKLRLEVDCNFRICIQIYEAAITCKVNMTMAAETKCWDGPCTLHHNLIKYLVNLIDFY